jgi:Tfp pilus assembly protein PilF
MTTTETELKAYKRQLVLHDGLAFLALLAITAVLFGITLFLFRSFSTHRADLAHEAGDAGRTALAEGRPHDAIASLRTALSYSPNQRDYELMLAQALSQDGHPEQANNYFLNLWDAQPGDGFINLQLARLARQRNDRPDAVNYYRASIFGNWTGDGVIRRRDVRLELANYFIEQKELQLAQTELLIAVSNAPSIPELNVALGDALLRTGDQADALKEYQKAMIEDPRHAIAFEKAGRLAYQQGDYAHAREWLEKAIRESGGQLGSAADSENDNSTLLKNSERLLALSPALATNRADRITRLLNDRAIAKKRFDACTKQGLTTPPLPVSMQAMTARWTSSANATTRAALLRDPANEDILSNLIDDTETLTAQLCGAPQGDDALLLVLAEHDKTH